ncbi:MAG: hypothetical protein LWY06_04625 [Firmicutes bacterium]|nr:hypothetical protein [Bacillota bacterium]
MKLTGIITIFSLIAAIFLATAQSAWSYVDPGSLGATYQVGYIVFYAVLSFFAFLFSPIKRLFAKLTGKKELTGTDKEDNQTDNK